MEKDQLAGQVVSLSLKLATFHSSGKQERQPRYVWRYEEIKAICFRLLESFWPSDPVRLIRIRVSECKNIGEVKKDKDIESFATKISKD